MNDYTRNNSTSSDTPQLAAAKFIASRPRRRLTEHTAKVRGA